MAAVKSFVESFWDGQKRLKGAKKKALEALEGLSQMLYQALLTLKAP